MAGQTTNYALPTYEAAADAAAAQTKANENATAITNLQTHVDALELGSFAPADTDPVLTVEQLAAARVTAAGIIYFKEANN